MQAGRGRALGMPGTMGTIGWAGLGLLALAASGCALLPQRSSAPLPAQAPAARAPVVQAPAAAREAPATRLKPAPPPDDGPPPWQADDGYRHRHPGVELVFDRRLGAYRVAGRSGHYFQGDRFYRLQGGAWSASVNVLGPWVEVAVYEIPSGLADAMEPAAQRAH